MSEKSQVQTAGSGGNHGRRAACAPSKGGAVAPVQHTKWPHHSAPVLGPLAGRTGRGFP